MKHSAKARTEIESIARRYAARIFLSTRPDLKIESSNHFRVSRLPYLQPGEAVEALKKMCRPADAPEKLAETLETENAHLLSLLSTPLMVALLLLHRRLTGKFPDTEQAFFSDLFDVLLRRHDQTKGYIRDRHSDASEIELSEAFCFISYVTRKNGAIESSRSELASSCAKAARHNNRNFDASGALDDIVQGTNLILEEGTVYRFAHKSIQEFYAAKFIVDQQEADTASFFKGRIKEWIRWDQVMAFVEIQDYFLFCKHFLHPHIGWIAFGDVNKRISTEWSPSKKAFDRIFGRDEICISDGRLQFYGCAHMSLFYPFRKKRFTYYKDIVTAIDWSCVEPEVTENFFGSNPIPADFANGNNLLIYSFAKCFDSRSGDSLRQYLAPVVKQCIDDILRSYAFVDHRSQQSDLFS